MLCSSPPFTTLSSGQHHPHYSFSISNHNSPHTCSKSPASPTKRTRHANMLAGITGRQPSCLPHKLICRAKAPKQDHYGCLGRKEGAPQDLRTVTSPRPSSIPGPKTHVGLPCSTCLTTCLTAVGVTLMMHIQGPRVQLHAEEHGIVEVQILGEVSNHRFDDHGTVHTRYGKTVQPPPAGSSPAASTPSPVLLHLPSTLFSCCR